MSNRFLFIPFLCFNELILNVDQSKSSVHCKNIEKNAIMSRNVKKTFLFTKIILTFVYDLTQSCLYSNK